MATVERKENDMCAERLKWIVLMRRDRCAKLFVTIDRPTWDERGLFKG